MTKPVLIAAGIGFTLGCIVKVLFGWSGLIAFFVGCLVIDVSILVYDHFKYGCP